MTLRQVNLPICGSASANWQIDLRRPRQRGAGIQFADFASFLTRRKLCKLRQIEIRSAHPTLCIRNFRVAERQIGKLKKRTG